MKKNLVMIFSLFLLFGGTFAMANQYGYTNQYQDNFNKMYDIQQQQLQIQKQQQMMQMQQQQQMTPAMEKEYLRGMCYQNCVAEYGSNIGLGALKTACMRKCDKKYE